MKGKFTQPSNNLKILWTWLKHFGTYHAVLGLHPHHQQKFHRNSNDTNEHVINWQKVRWPWRADVSSSISFHFPQCFRAVFSEVWNSFQNSRQFSEVSNNLRKPRIALRSLKQFLKVSYSFWFFRTFREYWTISISELHISDKSFNYDSSNIMKLEVIISIVLWLQVKPISNW